MRPLKALPLFPAGILMGILVSWPGWGMGVWGLDWHAPWGPSSFLLFLKPGILGFLLGAMSSALVRGEFRVRRGAAPLLRFLLGALTSLALLAAGGCPAGQLFRLSRGDLGAPAALAGLALGARLGVELLRLGMGLGAPRRAPGWAGIVGVFLLAALSSPFLWKQPAAWPAVISGAAVGALAQGSRFCAVAPFRDLFLLKDAGLFPGLLGFLLGSLAASLLSGSFSLSVPYQWPRYLLQAGAMALGGACLVVVDGCPLRQAAAAAQGDLDGAAFFLGLLLPGLLVLATA